MRGKGKVKSKGKIAKRPPVEMQRAMLTAQRAANLAVAGFPSFDQLKARTAKFFARVEKKLDAVPPERRSPPPATIAAQAALQSALLGEGSEVAVLQQMFENLLVASMDRSTANRAHPAFVQMLSQMSPDEARMISSLTVSLRLPIIEVRYMHDATSYLSAGFVCDFGHNIGIDESRQATSLSNLERLGIIDIIFTASIRDDFGEVYRALVERMKTEFKNDLKFDSNQRAGPPVAHRGIVQFSVIGQDLWETCVRRQR
jgi:hypothetical protein